MLRVISFLIVFLLCFFALMLGSQNTELVNLNLMIAQYRLPLSSVISASIFVGLLLGMALILSARLGKTLRRTKSKS